ncbi:hypothetical protein T440DRAFT_56772 [Plenodomus tracheiphilus IPT5]|uniref:Uncharacterized protein n=1 Tax=Plenodomus tracheiphilus IPT5 TaxID=1408161 RepID=A0A6A7B8M2_9PLEO|nr:hypothetical protein T440DRAFT_56772 [Plenodomus tracheiphilus IPT5]
MAGGRLTVPPNLQHVVLLTPGAPPTLLLLFVGASDQRAKSTSRCCLQRARVRIRASICSLREQERSDLGTVPPADEQHAIVIYYSTRYDRIYGLTAWSSALSSLAYRQRCRCQTLSHTGLTLAKYPARAQGRRASLLPIGLQGDSAGIAHGVHLHTSQCYRLTLPPLWGCFVAPGASAAVVE